MPKVTSYYPEAKMELALKKAVAAGKVEKGLKTDQDVAELLGLCKSTYCNHKKEGFKTMRLDTFRQMVRKLGFNVDELADIFGVVRK